MKLNVIRVSDIDATPPEFPRVVQRDKGLFLELEDGREYVIPDDPMNVLGLLHHFAGKVWANHRFYFHAIARMAQARGWKIHPYQS